MSESIWVRSASWLAAVLTPVIIVLAVVRLLINPALLTFEYNMPGFPPDSYGFTKEDRLYWGRYAVEYLVNDAGIEYLGDLRFADGSPVYNERELSHMLDVKIVVQAAIKVLLAALVVMLILGIWAWQGYWLAAFKAALVRGGWLTIFLFGGVILFVLLSFGVIFVAFHEVFFAEGTWTFYYSDTLIRMFPERFW
ncbi:MAG TPA: TIGR01906 family membrane protein, partial [Anaerolineales bacterium]|nr:TIGR01906 family membrane protein [Anaerolineales bacterium]